MSEYLTVKKMQLPPRLPLQGEIDLTWRCNNACRHCWVSLPADSPEKKRELSFDEIRRISDEARALGCRQWNISGGEPMLRPDFPEIFDFLTTNSVSYCLNTLHIVPSAPHGIGMRPGYGSASNWPMLLGAWLNAQSLVSK